VSQDAYAAPMTRSWKHGAESTAAKEDVWPPALRFRLTAVDVGTMFASEVRLPGARLFFEHHIEDVDRGVRITHQVTLSGPLSFLYLPSVRRNTEQALVDGVDRLAELAAAEG
jgi:hypothetical protein